MKSICITVLSCSAAWVGLSCSQGTSTTNTPLASKPDVPGTIFTIVFENEDATNVIDPSNPFFYKLANEYGRPLNYTSTTHPSLPNYIMMTSGALDGITTDSDPAFNFTIPGNTNIADQMDAAHVPWRAYLESMGDPCNTETGDLYSAHHNPFLYYWSMRMNTQRCNSELVDFDANFTADLASNAYRYMWISPNMCNDVHNCSTQTGDAWLEKVVGQIMDSPGYKAGGAIFILFDEGNTRILGAGAELPVIVVSPKLVSAPFQTQTAFDHRSYLASVEDILGLPRLATTANVTSMDELFLEQSTNVADAPTDAGVVDGD
ncbi:MAG TPA: alkaline phosphatase family protein [Polyangiaceae bacterium]|jgi:hypothetical protein|nr:alkaline phosphatase family protein [Polyangiaceae bacterium]